MVQNLAHKREQNFKGCYIKLDVHVGALEEDNGIILSFVCSDASWLKFNLGGRGET